MKNRILILLFFTIFNNANLWSQDNWQCDFRFQELSRRPRIEVNYKSSSRDKFEVMAEQYRITGDLFQPSLLYDSKTKEPWLWFEVTDNTGKVYSSRLSSNKTRINLYRRGPYYDEIHWFDLGFAASDSSSLPIKVEVTLYCYPEKVKASLKLYPGDNTSLANITIKGKTNRDFGAQSLKKNVAADFAFDLFNEEKPLSNTAFTLIKGKTPVTYNTRTGAYVIGTETVEGFQKQYFENPNGYETASFKVKNDERARKIYICHKTLKGEGIVEGGVLLDKNNHPLPILVQVSKNFDGEKEEKFYNPNDTAFSETYFPLYLEPYEEVEISSLHLYQNWGRHMTKHWSSLGFFMDYFHSSTGVTETTCYIPFKFGHKTGIAIGDFRAMSQNTFWSGQPQHDNVAGHNFLTFYDGEKWNYSEYKGTTYKSTGANWCNVEMEYLSSDSSISMLLDIWEVPQDDELRSFFIARYKILRPLLIDDAMANFRFLDISTTQQSLRYTHYAFTGANGNIISNPINFHEPVFCVKGKELPVKNSFATVYGEHKGANAVMIRSFESNTGIKPAFTIQHKTHIIEPKDTLVNEHKVYTPELGPRDIRFSLVPSAEKLLLKPGDEFTLSGFWLPYGEFNGFKTPEKEIKAYGTNDPGIISVTKGYSMGNLPATIQVQDNKAEFSLSGGSNIIPIIARGFTDYRNLMLYRKINNQWFPVRLNQNTKFDGNQVFCDTDGTYGAVFLVKTNGEEQQFRIMQTQEEAGPTKVALETRDSKKADIVINDPSGEVSLLINMNPLFMDNTLIKWSESEGNSRWCAYKSPNYSAGIRLTGFEDYATIQYWWQPASAKDSVLMPQFDLKFITTKFRETFKPVLNQSKWISGEKLPGQIIVYYSEKVNKSIAFAFSDIDDVYFKDKNTCTVRLKRQICHTGRRKVSEGKVYIINGKPDTLWSLIKHE